MESYLGSPGRRRALRAGAGSIVGALAGGLLGASRVATAQPLAGPVPEVDRLAIRVVTDSYHHAFEPSRKVGDVQVQRMGTALSKDGPPRTLQNEWGLSLHLESARGAETRQVLIDFGFTSDTLLNNLAIYRIDPAQLDALVLSHGHYDHFGGLVGFLKANGARLKPGLPFYLGGEECFCTREAGIGDNVGNFGYLDRKVIEGAGLKILFAERPTVVGGHAFTTGMNSSPTKIRAG